MRITDRDLENLVKRINKITGSPEECYKNNVAQVGNYCIDVAYSGVRLVRVISDKGGITVISHDGFGTKKELYNFMIGFINGLENQ